MILVNMSHRKVRAPSQSGEIAARKTKSLSEKTLRSKLKMWFPNVVQNKFKSKIRILLLLQMPHIFVD